MKLRSLLLQLSLPYFAWAIILAAGIIAILPACTSTGVSTASIEKFNAGVAADLSSPQGQQFKAALFSDAVAITAAALAKGTNPQADLAAANALGATLEAYSTLPTSDATIQQVATAETGAASNVESVVPDILALINAAKAKGATDAQAKQIVASGVYAATAAK